MRTVTQDTLRSMFEGAIAQIREHHELLSRLDSVGGDGDHGTTMLRAMTKVDEVLTQNTANDIPSMVTDIGWAIMGVDGGATGPLLGMFFISLAAALPSSSEIDMSEVGKAFLAGLAGVQAQTNAKQGDKTLLDALVPAVEALTKATIEGKDLITAFELAADAARIGAESTATMQARFGRAKNIKEKSIGTQDPGAVSIALLFNGFKKGIQPYA